MAVERFECSHRTDTKLNMYINLYTHKCISILCEDCIPCSRMIVNYYNYSCLDTAGIKLERNNHRTGVYSKHFHFEQL